MAERAGLQDWGKGKAETDGGNVIEQTSARENQGGIAATDEKAQ